MTRSVIRRVDWTIALDTAEGASPVLYEMECITCCESSGCSEVADDAQVWALEHSGRHPTHTGYRGVNTSFWRTTMDGDAATKGTFIGRQDAAPIIPRGTR